MQQIAIEATIPFKAPVEVIAEPVNTVEFIDEFKEDPRAEPVHLSGEMLTTEAPRSLNAGRRFLLLGPDVGRQGRVIERRLSYLIAGTVVGTIGAVPLSEMFYPAGGRRQRLRSFHI